ncbi:MAG TPA: hypothetical protein VFK47_23645, partial [Ktedonobacteraceae bacterium]|nr:hypothetical protein [Ktedonobacteraceae bacterium]
MQLHDFVAEEQPSSFRLLIASLKTQIKQDAVDIRAQKHEIRERQHVLGSGAASMEQYHLVTLRLNARARLLIYGTLRGKTWDQMENKHTMT